MDEMAIVTIKISDQFEEDFEIPRNAKCEKWLPMIEQYIRSTTGSVKDILLLYHEGSPIHDTDSLKSLGIWDGGVLDAEWR